MGLVVVAVVYWMLYKRPSERQIKNRELGNQVNMISENDSIEIAADGQIIIKGSGDQKVKTQLNPKDVVDTVGEPMASHNKGE